MAIYDWIALAVFIVAILGSAGFAGLSALRAWRTFRSARRRVVARLVEVTSAIAGAEARLARAGENAQRLDRAGKQLQRSLAALSLLTAAAGDARGALRLLPLLRR